MEILLPLLQTLEEDTENVDAQYAAEIRECLDTLKGKTTIPTSARPLVCWLGSQNNYFKRS